MMSWVNFKHEYEPIARSIDSSVKLVVKEGWFWETLGVLVMIFTFGGISRERFMNDYATTIGPLQAYPRRFEKLSRRLLVHECRHTRQARWLGLGIHPWVGLPLLAVLYLLAPLPLGFAWFRWRFEIDADLTSYRWMLKNGYSATEVMLRAKAFGSKVCGSNYGWSWLIGGVSGFEKAARKAIDEAKLAQAKPPGRRG